MSSTDSDTVKPEERSGAPGLSDNEGIISELEKGEAPQGPPVWVNDAPDGGVVAWLVVLGAWCTSFCSFGWLNSVGVFQEYYASGPLRGYSSSTIAWIPSLQVFFMMAMGPIVGKLFDKYGPRYLILGGTFLHVFGLMMASLSTEYYQLLLSQGICSAIGVSAIFQPSLGCIMGWFHKKRGIAYGILATGSSLGGVIFPIMLNQLIPSVGYGWAMRISAFLILFLLIIANLTVKARHPPRPGNLSKEQMTRPFKETPFLFLMGGMFLLTFGIYVPINYLPSQAISAGIDPGFAPYLVAILNAASLFGRLTSGFASDKIGKFNTFSISCYVTGILVLALWIPAANSHSGIIAFSALFGFFSGAYVSLIGALVAQISPLPEIGYRTGLVFLISALPGLVTSPVAGAILSNTHSWINLMIFSGVFLMVGTSVIFGARVSQVGWKPTGVF
ncbi:MFS general substrate transporter [Thozetella sp. PMI_491]|nr:MFS general substrate transporter [Thozetella sp. PMI_491]